jgi:hypothetical protein
VLLATLQVSDPEKKKNNLKKNEKKEMAVIR